MPFQWEDLTNCSTKTIMLWLVSSQVPEPALLTVSQVGALLFSASSRFQLYRKYWHKSCTCVTWRRSVMSASHGIKGKTSDQAFRAVSYNLYKRKQTKMHYKINLRSIIDTFSSMLSHSARNITVLVHLSPSPSVVFSHSRQKLSEKSLWMKNIQTLPAQHQAEIQNEG